MSRKIILIKQELLLLVYELNRSGLLAENEKIRKQAVVIDRKSGSAGMPRPISYAVFCLKNIYHHVDSEELRNAFPRGRPSAFGCRGRAEAKGVSQVAAGPRDHGGCPFCYDLGTPLERVVVGIQQNDSNALIATLQSMGIRQR